MAKYISAAATSGAGTEADPYGLAQFQALWNAYTGDLSGESYLFKTGTFGRLAPDSNNGLSNDAYNYTLGYYGTGEKPILAGSAIKVGTWTLHSGNVWYIAHTYNDSWFYGGQSAEGVITSSTPYGTRLEPKGSIANCLSTDLSQFFDHADSIGNGVAVYVNLGGLNPNNLVMEHCNVRYLLHHSSATATNITVDSIKLANGGDSNFFYQFGNSSSSFYIYDVESDQGGSYNDTAAGVGGRWARSDWGNCQIIGSAGKGNWLTDFRMERFTSTNASFAGLTLLYMQGANVYDLQIDNCVKGLGLWNDIVDSTFRRGTIINCLKSPDETTSAGSPVRNTQDLEYGIHVPPVGSGVNGDSYRNEISGYTIANFGHRGINLQSGHGWKITNNTIIAGENQSTTYPNNTLLYCSYTGNGGSAPNTTTTANNSVMAIVSNNVFVGDTGSSSPYFMKVGQSGGVLSHTILGDYNQYYTRGSSPTPFFRAESDISGTPVTYSTLAAWVTANASTGLDANSTYTNDDPPIQGYPTFSTQSGGRGISVISGLDAEPLNAVDDVADGALVGAGTNYWTGVDITPPAAPTVSGGTGGSAYDFTISYITTSGETEDSDITTYNLTAAENPTVTSPAAQTGCTHYNVYCVATGGTLLKQNIAPVAIGTDWVGPLIGARNVDSDGQKPGTISAFINTPEDSQGEPFLPVPDCGGTQHKHLTHPSRQLRSSSGWG